MATTGQSTVNVSRGGESATRGSDRLALLCEAGRRLSAALDLDELYAVIGEHLSPVAPHERSRT